MKLFTIFIIFTISLMLLACANKPSETTETFPTIKENSNAEVSIDILEPTDIQQNYYSRGIEPDGSLFQGNFSVTETSVPRTFQFTWLDGDIPAFTGVGLEYTEDIIAIGTEGPMVKLFHRTNNGYEGIFFTGQNLGVEVITREYTEDSIPTPSSLFPIVPWPEEIVFEMSGTNPDGTKYTGIIQTHPQGDGGQILWTQDDGSEISGGLIMLGNKTIIAAYSVGVVVYQYIENDVWRGEWYSLDNTALGVEFITPLTLN